MKNFNLFKSLVVAGVVFGALGIWATEESSGVRPLSGRAMGAVRGADPGNCTGNFSDRPCTDSTDDTKACFGATKEEDCTAKQCPGCSEKDQRHEICSLNQPWNSLCKISQNGEAPKGCGFQLKPGEDGAKCNWVKDKQTCRCEGPEDKTKDCARKTADKKAGDCEKFPKDFPK